MEVPFCNTVAKTENSQRAFLYFAVAIVAALAAAYSYVVYSVELRVLALFIILFCIVAVPPKHRFTVLLGVMPFGTVLRLPYFEFSIFTLVVGVFVLARLLGKRSYSVKLLLILLCLGIIAATNLFTTSVTRYLGWLLNLMAMYVVLSDSLYEVRVVEWVLGLGVGSFSSSMISYLVPQLAVIAEVRKGTFFEVSGVEFLRFQGLRQDANYYSQILLISMSLLVWSIPRIEHRVQRYLHLLLISFLFFFGIVSLSKMFVVTAPLILIQFLLTASNRKALLKNIYSIALLVLTIWMIFVFFLGESSRYLYDVFLLRFTDPTSGRFEALRIWLREIPNNLERLVFGFGLGAETSMLRHVHRVSPHNMYIEFLYMFGVTGIVAWILWLWLLYKYALPKSGRYARVLQSYFPILVLLVTGLSLDGHAQNFIYYFWILVIAVLVVSGKKQIE